MNAGSTAELPANFHSRRQCRKSSANDQLCDDLPPLPIASFAPIIDHRHPTRTAILLTSRGGTGDYAARLGEAVLFLIVMGIACTLGAAAATISLFRAEPLPWLAAIALIGNLLVIVSIFRLLVSE